MAVTENKLMKTSDLFVKCLENEGVSLCFGVPGEENLDFLESLRGSKIQIILTRHEQAAGFMAATVGRLTGHPGVCLTTLGPGATNLATSAAFAQLGGMPMMMITGQKPIRDSKQGSFQIVDIVEHMRPVTKFTVQVPDGNVLASIVRKATRISTTEKPGPVHIELPEDIAAGTAPDTVYVPNPIRRPIAEGKAIKAAVELLKQAKRPLLMIGAGANRQRSIRAIKQFVDGTGMYFFTTQMGKGVIDERHPKYLGCAALSSKDYIHAAVDIADVIINVGHDTVEKPPFFMHAESAETRKVIHLNFYPALVDNVYFPQVEVVGDIGNAIWQLNETIKAENVKFETPMFEFIKRLIDDALVDGTNDDSFPMNIARVVDDVRAVLPEDGIASLDNGFYKIWFARLFKAYGPNTVLLDNALATMGAGLPNAIAVNMLYPNRKVVSISGDGGFMMNDAELATAVQYNCNLVQIVLNDNRFGMIDWKQNNLGFPAYGLDLKNPDFVKHAESFGATGHLVTSTKDFASKLKLALDAGGVHVIEVPISYEWAKEKVKGFAKETSAIMEKAMEEYGPVPNVSSLPEENISIKRVADELELKDHKGEAKKMKPEPVAEEPLQIANSRQHKTDCGEGEAKVQMTITKGDFVPMYVGSKPVKSKERLDVLNKYTQETFCQVSLGDSDVIDNAIQLAEKAAPRMAQLKSWEKKKILMNVVKEATDRFEEFAQMLCVEAGKPIADARGEVKRMIITFELAAEEATRLYGEFQPLDISEKSSGYSGIVRRFPVGTISMISPFNFPLNLVAHKVAPAIAAGCPFVLKPASKTPLGALILGDILSKDPLLPEGAFSILPCTRDAADLLTTDERFKLLTFTGSPSVGWKMKSRAGKKKVVLELGGNAACVVDELVPNLEAVVSQVIHGAFYQSGQSCISVQRLFVNDSIYDVFRSALVEQVSALKAGDPSDPEVFIGPVISEKDAQRMADWIEEAVSEGGKVLCGGKRDGVMVEATIIENVPHMCKAFSEEVFGPVLCIEKYNGSDFRSIIDLVNDSDFGLQAGVFTNNFNKAFYAFENIEVGGVVINDVPSIRVDSQPYGGVKSAGLGREGIRYAIEDMTEMRVMLMKNAGKLEIP